MSLDPRLLSTFRAVAAAGRVSAAAKQLHLSQPAVTAQVHQLEAQCGQPLFVRSAQGVTLTAAGRVLSGYADQVAGLLEQAAEAVGGARAGGELVLAASTTVAAHLLPSLAADFLRTEGAVSLRIDVGNTDDVLRQVADGAVPMGLVEGHSRAPRVRLEPFVPDELVAMVGRAAGPELVRIRRAAELAGVPMIWREPGSGTRAVVERALQQALGRRRPRHPRDVQIGDTEGIKAAALAGLGVAFLSRWSARNELALGQLRVLPLRDLRVRRDFSWALSAAEPTGVAGRFLRFARLAAPRLSAAP